MSGFVHLASCSRGSCALLVWIRVPLGVWATCQTETSQSRVRGTDRECRADTRLLSVSQTPDPLRSGRIRVLFHLGTSVCRSPEADTSPGAGGGARPGRDARIQCCPALRSPALIKRKENIIIYVTLCFCWGEKQQSPNLTNPASSNFAVF